LDKLDELICRKGKWREEREREREIIRGGTELENLY
jgi:hypothetical protein